MRKNTQVAIAMAAAGISSIMDIGPKAEPSRKENTAGRSQRKQPRPPINKSKEQARRLKQMKRIEEKRNEG